MCRRDRLVLVSHDEEVAVRACLQLQEGRIKRNSKDREGNRLTRAECPDPGRSREVRQDQRDHR